jgi:hypothetical protein
MNREFECPRRTLLLITTSLRLLEVIYPIHYCRIPSVHKPGPHTPRQTVPTDEFLGVPACTAYNGFTLLDMQSLIDAQRIRYLTRYRHLFHVIFFERPRSVGGPPHILSLYGSRTFYSIDLFPSSPANVVQWRRYLIRRFDPSGSQAFGELIDDDTSSVRGLTSLFTRMVA